MARWWRWAALPFGAVYLILLGVHLSAIITRVNLDADAVSAPVIGQLFSAAPANAHVVLGEFGWYSTLLFELATKWLPGHRIIWVAAPYAMALASALLVAWAVWQVAGRFAASLSLVLLVCLAPATLQLLLSMTQHAPVWFCLAVLSAWLVLLARHAGLVRPVLLVLLALVVGAVVGINAASDPLVTISGLAPFVLALLAAVLVVRGPEAARMGWLGLATLVFAGAFWGGTLAAMSALHVSPQPGLHTAALASGSKVGSNLGLWLRSVAVLSNGDFFGHELGFTAGLSVLCAALGVLAVLLVPRLGWRSLNRGGEPRGGTPQARIAFMTFWSASAILLSASFVVSATPVDIHADRYLVGLVYAAAAVIPAALAARRYAGAAALVGTCVVGLAGVVGVAQGVPARNTESFPSPHMADRIARIAAREHVQTGYAGYWDAAPITWSARFRVRVYPVSICDGGQHLCPFDLHIISSWYQPHPGLHSFLLTDPALALVPAPPPHLGRPSAVYHVGTITMYIYPYDLATRLAST